MTLTPANAAGRFALGLVALCTVAWVWPQEVSRRAVTTEDGQVIGYSERRTVVRADGGTDREFVREVRQKEDNGRTRTLVEKHTLTRDARGDAVSIEKITKIGGRETVVTARLRAGDILIERVSREDRRRVTLARPADLRFDRGAALIGAWDQLGLDVHVFSELDVDAPVIEQVVIERLPLAAMTQGRRYLRSTFRDDSLSRVEIVSVNDSGGFEGSEQPWFGTSFKQRATEASAEIAAHSFVRELLVKSPVRIPREARQGHIRFGFKFARDVRFEAPETGEQNATANAEGFVLDVCEDCGPGLRTDQDYLDESLRPTFWLQSDHPRIVRFAAAIGRQNISDAEKMRRVARKATRRMKDIDFVGHYSAVEALQRRAGDCTEGAVVLAALGRALGIPTRVASGLVYSRERYHGVSNTFMPHAWTLAYVDGQWRSFDMSLEGFDATHIAFALSNGDPVGIASGHALAGLVAWDGLTEVRRPEPRTPPTE